MCVWIFVCVLRVPMSCFTPRCLQGPRSRTWAFTSFLLCDPPRVCSQCGAQTWAIPPGTCHLDSYTKCSPFLGCTLWLCWDCNRMYIQTLTKPHLEIVYIIWILELAYCSVFTWAQLSITTLGKMTKSGSHYVYYETKLLLIWEETLKSEK